MGVDRTTKNEMTASVNQQFTNSKNLVWTQLVPFVVGLALLLSISTNLRMTSFPVGPGELILAVLAV